jgi:hypothetical protein
MNNATSCTPIIKSDFDSFGHKSQRDVPNDGGYIGSSLSCKQVGTPLERGPRTI